MAMKMGVSTIFHRLSGLWHLVRPYLPPMNFITLHYLYFISVCFLASVIFWGSSKPAHSIDYTDSLFLVVSAMTEAGLNTVNLSAVTTFQQVILFLLIMLGSAIFVSAFVVRVRRMAFENRFQGIVEEKRKRRKSLSRRTFTFSRSRSQGGQPVTTGSQVPEVDGIVVRGRAIKEQGPVVDGPSSTLQNEEIRLSMSQPNGHVEEEPKFSAANDAKENDGATQVDGSSLHQTMSHIHFDNRQTKRHTQIFNMAGIGARQGLSNDPTLAPSLTLVRSSTRRGQDPEKQGSSSLYKYLESARLVAGFVGRNSQFHNLSSEEREQLGGVEYRAITLLEIIVPLYFVLFQLLGSIGIGAWITVNRPSMTKENGLNPFWTGVFIAVSAFNNSGMCLLDANMVAFQTSTYVLITAGFLILAGNTAYPCFLRLVIWTLEKLVPKNESWKDEKLALQFLLDHPRRCYMTLFPSMHTWYLLGSLIVLNGIDWAAFEILNIGNTNLDPVPVNYRILDGLFQALAVRSGGFYVANISELRIGLQVLYVLMMYISVYPVTITMRNSNVYEERSLGIYGEDEEENTSPQEPESQHKSRFSGFKHRFPFPSLPTNQPETSHSYFVRQQLRSQLAHDLWWICLAILFITIIETGQFERDPKAYSVFNVVFEVVSAYGCVGISVGLPGENYSFAGGWHKLSKLILCAVMIRGRHRGLPVAIDRAVLLPGEHLAAAEEEDAARRLERRSTRMTQ
ncbi:MAG: hypothetical protein M1834_005906 [Cirrosporium novae-zelandiae]|nr:MAG: hypothetical protein M1834_005906 [Cirrosporium novae-zelandiae]